MLEDDEEEVEDVKDDDDLTDVYIQGIQRQLAAWTPPGPRAQRFVLRRRHLDGAPQPPTRRPAASVRRRP